VPDSLPVRTGESEVSLLKSQVRLLTDCYQEMQPRKVRKPSYRGLNEQRPQVRGDKGLVESLTTNSAFKTTFSIGRGS